MRHLHRDAGRRVEAVARHADAKRQVAPDVDAAAHVEQPPGLHAIVFRRSWPAPAPRRARQHVVVHAARESVNTARSEKSVVLGWNPPLIVRKPRAGFSCATAGAATASATTTTAPANARVAAISRVGSCIGSLLTKRNGGCGRLSRRAQLRRPLSCNGPRREAEWWLLHQGPVRVAPRRASRFNLLPRLPIRIRIGRPS